MNIATIDIGTNTVLLLIAKLNFKNKTLTPIYNGFALPRLGKGMILDGSILPEKIDLLIEILKGYADIARKHNCEKILAIGTHALRAASNTQDILRLVLESTGIEIEVISGEQEALLSYKGVNNYYERENKTRLIIDIGGGSTECIIGNSQEIFFRQSLVMGVVTQSEKYFPEYPPSNLSILQAITAVENTISKLPTDVYSPEFAIAIGGTPTTLAAMQLSLQKFDQEKVEGTFINETKLDELITYLGSRSTETIRKENPSIAAGREDLLLSGTIILRQLIKKWGLKEVIASGFGIRYGVAYHFLSSSLESSTVQ